jgi:hypothetical protein
MATDLLVSLVDRPGELATLGETLGKAGINIEGGCGLVHEGRGIAHILVEDASAARMALETAGIKVEGESDVVIVDVSDEQDAPGALGRKARMVADAGVNMKFVYVATRGRLVIGAEDSDKARQALGA